jgi:ATPase family associated with various cellular activities (AAA)
MASYFLKSGNTYTVSSKEAMDLHETLPAGNYVVKQNPMSKQFYLEQIDSFEIKGKLYGKTTRHADRIINTFLERGSSTGVMLTGEKGSGKTLLTKKISILGAEQNIPTIVINAPWCGDGFNSFMQNIDQPCIVLFDEFEKVYDKEQQEAILTLLDGVYPSKKLFLLTCNDKWRVDSHMRNRPGRIFYMIDFKGLDAAFITEYCMDNLKATQHIEKICAIASMFDQFNFDMLKALVEDMNRYDEEPHEVLELLNAKPEFSGKSNFSVELQVNGLDVPKEDTAKEWSGNPLMDRIHLDYKEYSDAIDEDGDKEWDWEDANFSTSHLIKVDSKQNKFIYVNGTARLVLTKVPEKYTYNLAAL